MAEEQAPIKIVKKKGHGGHHGGAWKVAYADFVTAMMALFIVLWVLSQSDEVKEAVAHYFKDPVGFSAKSSGVIGQGRKDSGKKNKAVTKSISMREFEQKKFEELKLQIEKDIGKNKAFLKLAGQVEISIEDDGLRIEMVDKKDNYFFDIGSAHLKPAAREMLHKIGEKLKTLKNKIVIEGHTDARPFIRRNGVYTNFELSADRANAARRALIEGGLPPDQIDEVRGYADHRLRDPQHPYSLVNRRISIIIKYGDKTS